MRSRRALLAGVVLVFVLVSLLVLPATGRPPSIDVCDPCGNTFPVETVERSTAEVHVHENGTATWIVRNWMVEDDPTSRVDRLRRDGSFVDQVARESLEQSYAHRDAVLLDASMSSDDVVTMRYRTDFATWSFGVLRVEYLRSGYQTSPITGLGSDRLTIVGPAGYTVTSGIQDATSTGRQLTLKSFDSPTSGPFVVFAPEGDSLNGIRTATSIAVILVPRLVFNGIWLLLPAAVLAGFLTLEVTAIRTVLPDPSTASARGVGGGLVVLGSLVAEGSLVPVLVPFPPPPEPSLVVGGIATLVVGLAAVIAPDRLSFRAQVALIGVGLTLGALSTLFFPERNLPVLVPGSQIPRTILVTLAVAPVVAGLPVGYVSRHGQGRRRWLVFSVAALPLVFGAAIVFPPTAPLGNFFLLGIFLLVLLGIGAAILALPFVALGVLLPAAGDA